MLAFTVHVVYIAIFLSCSFSSCSLLAIHTFILLLLQSICQSLFLSVVSQVNLYHTPLTFCLLVYTFCCFAATSPTIALPLLKSWSILLITLPYPFQNIRRGPANLSTMFACTILGALLLPLVGAVSVNRTASSSVLQTWWHSTGEWNTQTPVLDGNVRQSGKYSVQVSTSSSYYDSFVYETIPRNGLGNIVNPLEPTVLSPNGDGISIEAAIGLTMAWTSFLYSEDVSVKITRLDGGNTSASNVIIRPTTIDYAKTEVNGDLYISVPYSSRGVRFSVEFTDDLYEFHSNCAISCTVGKQNFQPLFPYLNISSSCSIPYLLSQSFHLDWSHGFKHCLVIETKLTPKSFSGGLVQNTNPSGGSYWAEPFDSRNPIVGIEPLNSLLIFASAFPTSDMVRTSLAYHTFVQANRERRDIVSGLPCSP